MDRDDRRLRRQLDALSGATPGGRAVLRALLYGPLRYLRIPLGVALVLGGFFAILPVFGLWMIPLGLLLIAIDLPLLRAPVSRAAIRFRLWLRRRTAHGTYLGRLRERLRTRR